MNITKVPSRSQVPRHIFIALALATVVGCGGGSGPSSIPLTVGDPETVIHTFMEAVNDTNLVTMAQLWGTAAGPAADRMPRDELEKRLIIMQRYLANESFEVVLAGPGRIIPQSADHQYYSVRFVRSNGCTSSVPLTVVSSGSGWLVSDIDLAEAGTPGRPCNR